MTETTNNGPCLAERGLGRWVAGVKVVMYLIWLEDQLCSLLQVYTQSTVQYQSGAYYHAVCHPVGLATGIAFERMKKYFQSVLSRVGSHFAPIMLGSGSLDFLFFLDSFHWCQANIAINHVSNAWFISVFSVLSP